MPMKSQPDEKTPALAPPLFSEMNVKALDAVSAFAQANQRVLQELVEFSTAAAKEGVRTYAELQAAALDAARDAHALTVTEREGLTDLKQDPMAWYQRGLLTAVDGTQKALKLVETNAQVLTRSAERLQASAQRAGKEIQETLTSYMSRMKDLSGRN